MLSPHTPKPTLPSTRDGRSSQSDPEHPLLVPDTEDELEEGDTALVFITSPETTVRLAPEVRSSE